MSKTKVKEKSAKRKKYETFRAEKDKRIAQRTSNTNINDFDRTFEKENSRALGNYFHELKSRRWDNFKKKKKRR